MQLNLSGRETSDGDFEIIPAKTIAPVIAEVQGYSRTKADDADMMNVKFTITAGKYERRVIFTNFMVSSNGSQGHDKAVEISTDKFLQFVQSAYGIADLSTEAAQAYLRTFETDSLNGIEFVARIGVEKDKTGEYEDKNVISGAVLPTSKQYEGFQFKPLPAPAAPGATPTGQPTSTQQAAPPQQSSKPAWAQ